MLKIAAAAFVLASATAGGAVLADGNGADASFDADTRVEVGADAEASLAGTTDVFAKIGSTISGSARAVTEAVIGADAEAGTSSSVDTSTELSADVDADASADADGSIGVSTDADGSLVLEITP